MLALSAVFTAVTEYWFLPDDSWSACIKRYNIVIGQYEELAVRMDSATVRRANELACPPSQGSVEHTSAIENTNLTNVDRRAPASIRLFSAAGYLLFVTILTLIAAFAAFFDRRLCARWCEYEHEIDADCCEE